MLEPTISWKLKTAVNTFEMKAVADDDESALDSLALLIINFDPGNNETESLYS